MDQVKIGKFISKIRKEKNITQKELADKLGVTDKTVSRWENGHYLPDVSLWKDLCEILGISVLDLMNGEIKEITKEELEDSIFNTVKITNKKVRNMKKKTIIILLISLLVILGTIIISVYQVKKNKKEPFVPISFTSRYASVEKENGWVCYFKIEDYENNYTYYGYNCVNLKYESLDDYYATGQEYDKNGELFTYRTQTRWVSYHWSSYEPDVSKIDKYFQDNNFKDIITLDDLKDLELETGIDKVEVLNLYNKAIESTKVNKFGNFMDFQPVKVTKSMNVNDYEWTFGYNEEHGRLENVYLNCKYNDVWLDEIENRTEYQEEMLNLIPEIEHYILKNQSLKLPSKYDKDVVYSNLIATLDSIKKIEYND